MYRRHKSLAVLNLLLVLAVVVMFSGAAYAQGPVLHLATTQPEQGQTFTAAKPLPAGSGQRLVPVVVRLQSEPLATYSGGLPGLAPTNPATTGSERIDLGSANSKAYLARLDREHQDFKARVASIVGGARVTHDFSVVLNATSMLVPADKIAALAAQPGVAAVYPDELLQLNTDNSPQFIGAPTAWRQLGGQESAGQGVIVGVLDTGIWPEHPSFSNPDPSGKPYPPPPPTQDNHARACQFSGGANPGPAFACNNKLIGAQRFMSTYEAFIGLTPEEYTSARDDDGHGTHTSSTSAGNASVAASIFGISRGNVSGIAPRAYVMMYKVCGAEGCFGSDSAAAVEQAIRDGVNVINFSISGGANPYSDAVELAFLDAYQAGVFVAASAGNAGPAADTTDHRGPWTTTVAASTQNRAFQTTATVTGGGASLALSGASITGGIGPTTVFLPPAANASCGPFTPGSLTGLVVVCVRGGQGRAEKGYNVKQAGGAGMILYNQAANVTDLETDNHYLPAVHIQFSQGQALLAFLAAHPGATVSWPAGAKVAAQGDVMASFSSRGGPGQTLGVSKPDITAPGVQILAGASPQHLPPPAGVALGPQGELFQAIAGTSMSSPHIAGSAALIKALHPTWTPGQIKSALMTTAVTSVVKEDGTTPANAFDDGSGRVNLNQAGDPGLTFDETAAGYVAHQADLWNANYPSVFVPVMPGLISVDRTAHNTTNRTTAWQLKVVYPANADFKISVPPAIVVPAGGDRKFSIVINGGDVPLGQVRMATLYLTQSGDDRRSTTLHIPITFIRKQAAVALTKSCAPAVFARGQNTTCTITASNGTFSNAPVSIVDRLPDQLRVVPGSVAGGVGALNVVLFRGTLAGAQPPDVSVAAGVSPAGYVPLSAFGIAPIAGVGDETAANFNVPSFTFAGESYSQVGVVSNGYVIVGGAAGSADIQFANQHLPDPVRPNNVIAPFWTDFNPAAGGEVRIGVLTDGVDSWIVVDYAGVKEYSTAALDTFEVWIGINTDTNPAQDISMVYGPLEGTGDGGLMTVGAENNFGNRGASYYFNGTGTPPTPSTELVVSSIPGVPGETHVTTFRARGQQTGKWTNYASMTSDLFQGASIAPFSGEVTR